MALTQIDFSKELPEIEIYIYRPDGTAVGKLKNTTQPNIKTKLKDTDELDFNIPFQIQKFNQWIDNPTISLVKNGYLLKTTYNNDVQWFKVKKIVKSDEGEQLFQVSAFSREIELAQRKLLNYSVKSYTCTQVLNDVLSGTNWTIGIVDSSFDKMYRDFDENSKTVLDFILNIMTATYKAIAIFDTVNRTVSLYLEETYGENKGLRARDGQYIKTISEESNDETLVTRLYCFGNNDSSIETANPTGEKYIDNFDGYLFPYQEDGSGNVIQSSYYMSDSLSHALITYNALINSKSPIEQDAEAGTNETTIKLTAHGLSVGDYIVNRSRGRETRVVLTVPDANTITVASIVSQTTGDQIQKYPEGTFGKLLFQRDDLKTQLNTKQDELDTLNLDKNKILDQLVIQRDAKTIDSYVSSLTASTVTRTLSGQDTTFKFAAMVRISTTTGTTVTLNGSSASFTADTWTALGKMTGSALYNISVTTTQSNLSIRTMIVKITDTEYSTSGNESTIIDTYSDDNKQIQINAKQSEIDSTNSQISSKNTQITTMSNSLKLSSNLTSGQLDELNNFIYEDEYKDDNIVDAYDLYDAGVTELSKRNTPQLVYKVNIVDFEQSITEQKNWGKLILGDTITLHHERLDIDVQAKILEIERDFESVSTNLTIGNDIKKLTDKQKFIYDLYKSIHTTKKVENNASDWTNTNLNFSNRNDRISIKPNNPTINSDATAIDHIINDNGSVDITFEWNYNDFATTNNDADNIDGFFVYVYSSDKDNNFVFGSSLMKNPTGTVDYNKRTFAVYSVAANKYYTFGIQAYRAVDTDIDSSGILKSDIIQPSLVTENPYRPSNNVAFKGDLSGTIEGTSTTTVVSYASNGNNAWSKFSGLGNTLPSGNVEFNYANSTTKGGNATNTDSVGSQSANTVQNATINFNNRNDRKNTVPADATIASDGTAIDHTINTDGSADISFEWSYSGTGDAYDIDGFIVYIYQSTTNAAYTFGTTPVSEQVYYITPEKRAFIIYGIGADKFYKFGIQAYRVVDQDVNTNGILKSNIVSPSLASENPYQPSSSVSFAGDITGTVNGTAASTIKNAAINFNNRNDRKATSPANPTIATDGTAIDHIINTDGSADISFEWAFTGTGDAYDVDGFIIYTYQSSTNSAYTFGTTPSSEQVYYVTSDKRAFILHGASDKYYTFGVESYRIVDQDVNASGVLKSAIVQSAAAGENPYQPSSSVAFGGNITGTINGTSSSTVVTNANNGNTAYNGTTTYRDTTAPNGTFTCNNLTSTTNTDGSIDVTISWTFAQGTVRADGFVVVYENGQNVVPTSASHSYYQDSTTTKLILPGVSADAYHNFKIYAYRTTNTGVVIGALTNGVNWLNYQATSNMFFTNLLQNGGAEIYTGKSGTNIPDGWLTYQPSNLCTFTRRVNDPSWTLAGNASFEINAGADTVNTYGAYFQDYKLAVAGQTYTLSAIMEGHRCVVYLRFEYYDVNGTLIGSDNGTSINNVLTPTKLVLTKTTPANCTILRCLLWKQPTNTGQTDSYLFADNVKLEKGSIATPYTESNADAVNNTVQQGALYNNVKTTTTGGIEIYDGNNVQRLQIANLGNNQFGIRIKNSSGTTTVETNSDGTLALTGGSITVTHSDGSQSILDSSSLRIISEFTGGTTPYSYTQYDATGVKRYVKGVRVPTFQLVSSANVQPGSGGNIANMDKVDLHGEVWWQIATAYNAILSNGSLTSSQKEDSCKQMLNATITPIPAGKHINLTYNFKTVQIDTSGVYVPELVAVNSGDSIASNDSGTTFFPTISFKGAILRVHGTYQDDGSPSLTHPLDELVSVIGTLDSAQ